VFSSQWITVSCILQYLDGLFQKDPKAGGRYHQKQVELYATFDEERLLPFLRSCTDIPLQQALQVCEHHKRYEEMVFLLGKYLQLPISLLNYVEFETQYLFMFAGLMCVR
jgi:hypothetical protein